MCYEIAIRPKRKSNNVFFIHGDRITLQSSNDIAISYIEEQEENEKEEEQQQKEEEEEEERIEQSNEDIDDKVQLHPQQHNQQYTCSSPYCNETFTSIKQSQLHYESNHCFQCHHCMIHNQNNQNTINNNNNRYYNYPNEHLLDLHLKEIHDIYYLTGLKQKKIQYTCLVMTCNYKFYNEYERFQHLMNDHGYPIWFRFHSRRRRRRSTKGNMNGDSNNNHNMNTMSNKTKQWWYNKRMNYNHNSKNSNNSKMDIENSTNNHNNQQSKQQQQIQKRKERKKELNKNIPCRFYNSKSGCWRGTNCMFLHSKIHNNDNKISSNDNSVDDENENRDKNHHDLNNNNMDICTEIDMLANEINTKANISIPDNISFGRRRRRR